MKKKWDRSAMRFTSARYIVRQSMLDVTFENGDHFLVAAEVVAPLESCATLKHSGPREGSRNGTFASPDWTKIRIGEMGDALEIPHTDGVIEIPWDRVRSVADPDFRAHLADRAEERARRIGRRVRVMRIEAGLSPSAFAEKIGVAREVVANLEVGKIEPHSDLIEKIVVALGKRLRDFADE